MTDEEGRPRASRDTNYAKTFERLIGYEHVEVTLTVKDMLLLIQSISNAQTAIIAATNTAMVANDTKKILEHAEVASNYIDISIRSSNNLLYSVASKVLKDD